MPVRARFLFGLLLLGVGCGRRATEDASYASVLFAADGRTGAFLGAWDLPGLRLSVQTHGVSQACVEVLDDGGLWDHDLRDASFDGQALRFELVSRARAGSGGLPTLFISDCALSLDDQAGRLLLVRSHVRLSHGSESQLVDAPGYAVDGVVVKRMAN